MLTILLSPSTRGRMKRGTDEEADLLGRVMPILTCDIFPPADILNRILSEFMSSRTPVAYSLTPTIFKVPSFCFFCFFVWFPGSIVLGGTMRKGASSSYCLAPSIRTGIWYCSGSGTTESSPGMDPSQSWQFHPGAERIGSRGRVEYPLLLYGSLPEPVAAISVRAKSIPPSLLCLVLC